MTSILHDHLLALLHSGHEVEFAPTKTGVACTVTRGTDDWTAVETTPERALWAASPLHGDDETFPGDLCPAVSPGDGQRCTEPPGHDGHHYGPDTGSGIRRMWLGGELPEPGIEQDVETLSADVSDLGDRVGELGRKLEYRSTAMDAFAMIIRQLLDERPRPLPAPCAAYEPARPYGPCATCGRTREAHRLAAASRSAYLEALADELEAARDALAAIDAEQQAGRIDEDQAANERAQLLDAHVGRVDGLRAAHGEKR